MKLLMKKRIKHEQNSVKKNSVKVWWTAVDGIQRCARTVKASQTQSGFRFFPSWSARFHRISFVSRRDFRWQREPLRWALHRKLPFPMKVTAVYGCSTGERSPTKWKRKTKKKRHEIKTTPPTLFLWLNWNCRSTRYATFSSDFFFPVGSGFNVDWSRVRYRKTGKIR